MRYKEGKRQNTKKGACLSGLDICYFFLNKGFIMFPTLNLGTSGYQDSPRGRKSPFPKLDDPKGIARGFLKEEPRGFGK